MKKKITITLLFSFLFLANFIFTQNSIAESLSLSAHSMSSIQSDDYHSHHIHNAAPDRNVGGALQDKAFLEKEKIMRRHSFILLGPAGHFAYHVPLFNDNHQHQVLVKGELFSPNGIAYGPLPTQNKLVPPSNRFYSVSTDPGRRFTLNEIFLQNYNLSDKNSVTLYDGLIGQNPKKIFDGGRYTISEVNYHSPLYVNDLKSEDSYFITTGSYGAPRRKFFLAHLMLGADNFEQIVEVTMSRDVTIDNGCLIKIAKQHHDKTRPLPLNSVFKGTVVFDNKYFAPEKNVRDVLGSIGTIPQLGRKSSQANKDGLPNCDSVGDVEFKVDQQIYFSIH